MFRRSFLTFALLANLGMAVVADEAHDLSVHHAYAISSGAMAMSGAAFMVIHNSGMESRTLVEARADVAARIELHTNIEDENGVMRMRQIEGGIAVASGGMAELARGGDHVMFMGITDAYSEGTTFPLTLVFDDGTELVVDVEVMAASAGNGHGAMADHMSHDHDDAHDMSKHDH